MTRRASSDAKLDRRMRADLGARVRSLREQAGLTQEDLVGPNLSRAGIAKIETGASWPSIRAIVHLGHALRVRPRLLIPKDW